MTQIDWDIFTWNELSFVVARTDEGVCYVNIATEHDEWKDIVSRHRKNVMFTKTALPDMTEEIIAYLNGEIKEFSFPVDLAGTPFQLDVWHATKAIGYGETKSYGEIAKEIHHPKAIRAVGSALGANPLLFVIPCHRVIAQNGKLTGYRAGITLKKQLLTMENKTYTPK